MTYLLFATAFGLSAIAAYYSIMGLVAIFAAAAIPIFIMGSLLEVSKLVVASWLYRSWKKIPKLMMAYFTTALFVLMMLTSMGIFGYLSKAHLDQAVPTGDVAAKLSLIEEKIKTEKDNLNASRAELNQLDSQVNETISRSANSGSGSSTGANSGTSGVERSIAIRRAQQKDRTRILAEIGTTQAKIAKLQEERAPIATEVRKVEAEVGPIKYIAQLIYGQEAQDADFLEKAVRIVILMIVVVFDPLAVLMLIAANWQMRQDKEEAEGIQETLIPSVTIPEEQITEVIPEPEPERKRWSDVLFKKKSEPLPDEAKVVIDDFFHKDEVKVEDNAKVSVTPADTIVEEVNKLQKHVEYDSAGRRITP